MKTVHVFYSNIPVQSSGERRELYFILESSICGVSAFGIFRIFPAVGDF